MPPDLQQANNNNNPLKRLTEEHNLLRLELARTQSKLANVESRLKGPTVSRANSIVRNLERAESEV